jgi:hypothetical protein
MVGETREIWVARLSLSQLPPPFESLDDDLIFPKYLRSYTECRLKHHDAVQATVPKGKAEAINAAKRLRRVGRIRGLIESRSVGEHT